MGIARLLAKGWVVFCLFAGAHGYAFALGRGEVPADAAQAVAICVALFGAAGLLFIGGLGAATSGGRTPILSRLRPHHFVPDFNDVVFVLFASASFALQAYLAPAMIEGGAAKAIGIAIAAVVPGQSALAERLAACTLDGGRVFASAFAWLLAMIYVASSLSRLRLSAGLLRIERALRPSAFGLTVLAAVYGLVAIVSFQLLYVGSAYGWIDCPTYADITGQVLIGLAPLLLAYLIVAALVTLRASGPDES